jgi:kynureninase
MTAMTPTPSAQFVFDEHESTALALDDRDPLREFRAAFELPTHASMARAIPAMGDLAARAPDQPVVYLTGNSLGLMPRAVRALVHDELDDWATLGVEGHLHGRRPWYSYHEAFRAPLARLVGAGEDEVVAMNSLTVNLHVLMATFYRPTGERRRIMIEDTAFPSDTYAVASRVALHGLDPRREVVRLRPRTGEATLRTEDIVEQIRAQHGRLALVLLGGVNYYTGQWLDMPAITRAAHEAGAVCGWDLAHAIGNVPMRLHDWDADFACWCSYKYLNAGPGAVGGAYVHRRHAGDLSLPQLAGWWGNDPATRFAMSPDFTPVPRADRWAMSNPPILSLAPLHASLDLFARAGLDRLRAKSLALTAYASWQLEHLAAERPGAVRVLTPREPDARGCQWSLVLGERPREVYRRLQAAGIVCDFREPDVIRAAPVPLYNSFHDVWRFARALREVLS